jgi:hypothetical protein
MRIVRNRSHENFTVVANEVVNDHRLSFRALGLLVELLSKPDNWRTSASDLSRERKEGRDAVRAALGEIEAAGYLMRVKRQNSAGQWSTQWELFDRPQNPHHGPPGNGETGGFPAGDGFPGFGNPDAGEPDSGEPGPIARTESKDGDQRTTSAGSADAPEGQLTLLDDPSLPSVSAQRRRRRDLLWEAVLRVCGVDGS